MNFKNFLIAFSLLILSNLVVAQGPQFGLGLGYASFNLENLKDAQEDALRFSNLENIKATESFPDRAYASFFLGLSSKINLRLILRIPISQLEVEML
jgi:hypothetical protein